MSKVSKFLSRVLRHEPESIGIRLGKGGWVGVDDLLRGMRRAGHRITPDALHQIIMEDDKTRFTLSQDGRRIRAAQGHSLSVDLDLDSVEPPRTLFHGTARANLDSIFATGLGPGRRQRVHLSPDAETALQVGMRHGRPVVLRINAAAMHEDGMRFWRANLGPKVLPSPAIRAIP